MFANAYLISGSNSSKLERETRWLIGCGKNKASPLLSGATHRLRHDSEQGASD